MKYYEFGKNIAYWERYAQRLKSLKGFKCFIDLMRKQKFALIICLYVIRWSCEPVDYSMDVNAVRIAGALWWYYASKLFEMLGTSIK
jgi:hypothetical protein